MQENEPLVMRLAEGDDLPLLFAPTSWADAEAKFPGCSVAWNRDGGHAWLRDRPNTTIVITSGRYCKSHLSIGCNDHEPYGWAFYNDETERWSFM